MKFRAVRLRVLQFVACALFVICLGRFWIEWAPGYTVALSPAVHVGNLLTLVRGKVAWLTVVPVLALLVFSLIANGRLFCFHCCPVGFLQDIVPSFRKKEPRWALLKRSSVIFLSFAVFFSLVALNIVGVCDPLVIVARVLNLRAQPFRAAFILVLVFPLFIVATHLVWRRFWCFHCCPLGAWFDSVRYVRNTVKKQKQADTDVRISKRSFLAAALGGLALGTVWRCGQSTYASETLIRPPGALAEAAFKQACIRCGNCMHACITGGLQPAFGESGWDGLFTPRLVPRIGECDEYCRRCGYVCPTGALKPLSPEEKHNARIGLAYVKKELCLGWSGHSLCLICGEFCPYLAIDRYMKNGTIPCPVVKDDVCRGCGICEKQCPTHAIRVKRRATTVV